MPKPTEEQKKFANEFKRISKELMELHSSAANVISRADNNQVFEVSWYMSEISERIKKGYPNTNYKVLSPVRPRNENNP